MAPGFHVSWLLVCWLVVTMAEGRNVVTPPGGSQNNVNPTDCQIFTLTPPPTSRNPVTRATRNPVTGARPITRIPRFTSFYFPQRRPGFYPRLPNRLFLFPNYHLFQFRPFYLPQGRLIPWRYFLGRYLQSRSSSEEA